MFYSSFTAALSESKVPKGALDKCNTTAAAAADDDDDVSDEGKNGDFASFKEELMKEDGYSNECLSEEILLVSIWSLFCALICTSNCFYLF